MAERQIFDEVPTGEPDPRQEQFRAVMATIEGVTVIPMEGFRASHIDFAWIQEQVLDFVIVNPELDCDEVCALIAEELPTIIQRLKSLSVGKDDWPDALDLELETKDDNGSYHYRLRLPVD